MPFLETRSAAPRNVKRPPSDQEKRERQLGLVAAWRARGIKITTKENKGRITVSPADLERYRGRKAGHTGMGMYATEGSAFAEYMFLEGTDADGVTELDYQWFGDEVKAYEPSDVDDVTNGADAILMFTDSDDERIAYPVVIDVATSIDDVPRKQMYDLNHFTSADPSRLFSNIYWYDTTTELAGTYVDEPKEGKIPATNLTVYIPGELAQKFSEPTAAFKDMDREMRMLGPFILKQMQIELELQALLVLNALRRTDLGAGKPRFNGIQTQEDLQAAMETEITSRRLGPEKTKALAILNQALKTTWASQKSQTRDGYRVTDKYKVILEQILPTPGFHGLKSRAELENEVAA